jgi:hypothetical protein
VPFFNFVIVHDVFFVVHERPPGDAVTTYVTFTVFLTAGHENFIAKLDVVVLMLAGNSGRPSGRTIVDPTTLSPIEFLPVIVTV